ncbi:MAG: hypothetical protein R3F49_06940 [Planctomycetota bacterium]
MKPKFLIFILFVAGLIAYTQFPGFKAKAENFVNQYGGWTTEAIEKDPAAFITSASEKLKKNIASFEEAKAALGESKRTAETKLAKFKTDLGQADLLATAIKEKYKTAKASGAFPVEVAGDTYTEEKLIQQVELLLTEKANAQARIEDYTKIVAQVEEKRQTLNTQIAVSKTKIDELDAKAAMVKVDKMSADMATLLAQVNDVVESNGKVLAKDSDPVRSLQDMMTAIETTTKNAPEAGAPKSEALAFLND